MLGVLGPGLLNFLHYSVGSCACKSFVEASLRGRRVPRGTCDRGRRNGAGFGFRV